MNMTVKDLFKIGFILFCVFIIVDSRQAERDQQNCGIPLGTVGTGKIVGGYDVGYYKYPWYVALKVRGDAYCGGTLIHSKFIVTAAHCFQPFFKTVDAGKTTFEKIFTPTFGIYDICKSEPTQKEFKVAKVHIHESYKKKDPYFDIALIKLKTAALEFVPCCLPRRKLNSRTRPREAYISGLGDMKYNTMKSTCTMHEARILTYGDDVCKDMLNAQKEDGKLLKHAFCAGYMQGGIDACQGDSGGPLIIQNRYGGFDLLGITSFGFECAKPGTLGLYTDVSHYLHWLRDKMDIRQNTTDDTSPAPVNPEPPATFATPSGDGSNTDESGTDESDIVTSSNGVSTTESDSNSFSTTNPTTSSHDVTYPATIWELVPSDYPSLQPMPATKKPPHHHKPPHHWGDITIVINKKKKQEEMEKRRRHLKQKRTQKHKKERKKDLHRSCQ